MRLRFNFGGSVEIKRQPRKLRTSETYSSTERNPAQAVGFRPNDDENEDE